MALPRPARPAAQSVPDNTTLSQYGRIVPDRNVFRNGPRADREVDVSVLLGRCAVTEITELVTGRHVDARDRVRHTTVGKLREAGFVVISTPSRRNPGHVSVKLPGDVVPWDQQTEERFDKCFEEGGV